MKKNRTFLTIGFIIFLDNIGAGMIVPLLPILFMNSEIGLLSSSSVSIRSFYFGLSYMLFPIMALFSNPYLGFLSDYKGRKFVLKIGMSGFIFTNLITILSIITHNLWLFLFTRLILGFFGGSYTAASATLIEISTNEQEKIKNIKLMTLISIMGFIISPAFSMLVPSKLTTLSLTLPFTLIFILSILNLVLIILFFPKMQQKVLEVTQPRIFHMLYTSFCFIFRSPNILKLGGIFFLFQLGYCFYFQILALYLQQIYNFSLRQTGLLFFMMGVCYIFGMYIVHPFLNRFLSNNIVTSIGIISASLLIGVLGVNELLDLAIKSQIYLIWLINALLFIMVPLASINISRQFIEIAEDNQGLVMGALGQITSLSLICSAVLVSFHIYFGNFVLLIASFIIFIVFLLQINYFFSKLRFCCKVDASLNHKEI